MVTKVANFGQRKHIQPCHKGVQPLQQGEILDPLPQGAGLPQQQARGWHQVHAQENQADWKVKVFLHRMEVPPTLTNLQASRGDEVRCKPGRRKPGGVEVRRIDDYLFF